MGRELDLLVAPLRGPEVDGDDPGAVDPPEVAEDERVARLRLVRCPVGQAEVPRAVLVPVVRVEVAVLVVGPRLPGAPVAPDDVLP